MNFIQRQEQRANFKVDLETEFGTTGHRKADKLFELAWDYGHSSSLHAVEMYYGELVELIK